MFQDQLVDWRNEFSKWWQAEFKAVKFPAGGTVFGFFVDPETKRLLPWDEKVLKFELDTDIPLQVYMVPAANRCHFYRSTQMYLSRWNFKRKIF